MEKKRTVTVELTLTSALAEKDNKLAAAKSALYPSESEDASGWVEAESPGRSTDQDLHLYRLESFVGRQINCICKYSADFRQSIIYPIYLRVGPSSQYSTTKKHKLLFQYKKI